MSANSLVAVRRTSATTKVRALRPGICRGIGGFPGLPRSFSSRRTRSRKRFKRRFQIAPNSTFSEDKDGQLAALDIVYEVVDHFPSGQERVNKSDSRIYCLRVSSNIALPIAFPSW